MRPNTAMTYDQALNRAASLCSAGERCSSDIFEKATEWGLTTDDAARLVDYLVEEHFVDDKRFTHAFVHDKYTYQHWGRIKIRYTLRQKGIEEAVINDMFEELITDEDYLEACVGVLSSKFRGMELPLSANDRARLYRFASQRGFEPSVISKACALLANTDS